MAPYDPCLPVLQAIVQFPVTPSRLDLCQQWEVKVCDFQGEVVREQGFCPLTPGLLTLGEVSHHVKRALKQSCQRVLTLGRN